MEREIVYLTQPRGILVVIGNGYCQVFKTHTEDIIRYEKCDLCTNEGTVLVLRNNKPIFINDIQINNK
jgi:hypothetical protein